MLEFLTAGADLENVLATVADFESGDEIGGAQLLARFFDLVNLRLGKTLDGGEFLARRHLHPLHGAYSGGFQFLYVGDVDSMLLETIHVQKTGFLVFSLQRATFHLEDSPQLFQRFPPRPQLPFSRPSTYIEIIFCFGDQMFALITLAHTS